MLHPTQFEINEAWVAFMLNETPICTELQGDFDCIALMDAASGFILGNAFVPSGAAEPSTIEVRKLLAEAKAHRQELPRTLFIPSGQLDHILPAEAARQGIAVVRVPEDQLLVFIGEARASFKEHFGGGRVQ